MNTQNPIDYRRFASIPHGEMCTWAAWVADLEETTPETEENEPRCDCGLGRVIDEYTELVAALEACLDPDDCSWDHNGNCQAHYDFDKPHECYNAVARALLARVRGEEKQG